MAKNTRKLLETALACLDRKEDEAAKVLLTLAAEGEEEAPVEDEESLKEKAKSAIEDGDYAKAAEITKELCEKAPAEGAASEEPSSEEEPAEGAADESEDYSDAEADVDSSDDEAKAEEELPSEDEPSEAEGDASPGDAVKELPPEKVAALVTLASTIKKGGHPDLAKKITKALGL